MKMSLQSEVSSPAFEELADIDERIEHYSRAYLGHAPLSLALREVNRLLAMDVLDARASGGLRTPVLDVGCGDGHWWALRNTQGRAVYGIDISASEIRQAQTRIWAECVDVSKERPFPSVTFSEIIGNCSLEHVPDIDGALRNLRRAVAADGRMVLFVPTPRWAFAGLTQAQLLARAPRLAMMASGALNGFFQHWHLYELPVWRALLHENGWNLTEAHGLGNERSEFLFRLFLPASAASFAVKAITGSYANRLLKRLPRRAMQPQLELMKWALRSPLVDAAARSAYEYLIIAEPRSDVRPQ